MPILRGKPKGLPKHCHFPFLGQTYKGDTFQNIEQQVNLPVLDVGLSIKVQTEASLFWV